MIRKPLLLCFEYGSGSQGHVQCMDKLLRPNFLYGTNRSQDALSSRKLRYTIICHYCNNQFMREMLPRAALHHVCTRVTDY